MRDRRLSAGSQDARHPADARKSSQGTEDDSGGQAAEDRSGDGRKRPAGEIVEVVEAQGGLREPTLFARDNIRQAAGTAPRAPLPTLRSSSLRSSPWRVV